MTERDDMQSRQAKRRRWWLAASLLLNIFLITVIGGRALHTHLAPAGHRTMLAAVLSNAQAILPPDDARVFVEVMRRKAPQFDEAAGQLVKARRAIEAQINAEPFDKIATRAALDDWRGKWVRFFDEFREPLIEALASVSPEGRRKLLSDPDGRGPFLARNEH